MCRAHVKDRVRWPDDILIQGDAPADDIRRAVASRGDWRLTSPPAPASLSLGDGELPTGLGLGGNPLPARRRARPNQCLEPLAAGLDACAAGGRFFLGAACAQHEQGHEDRRVADASEQVELGHQDVNRDAWGWHLEATTGTLLLERQHNLAQCCGYVVVVWCSGMRCALRRPPCSLPCPEARHRGRHGSSMSAHAEEGLRWDGV